VYYRWMRPKTWLFPGTIQNWRADKPITPKVVWDACRVAAARAQLEKRVSPHLLRHYAGFRTMPSKTAVRVRSGPKSDVETEMPTRDRSA